MREIDIIGIIACISMLGVIVAFVAINSMEKQIDWLMEKLSGDSPNKTVNELKKQIDEVEK